MADLTKGGTAGLPYGERAKCYVLRNTVDFSETNLASAAVGQVLNIPAGVLVLRAGHRTITAEGATAAGTLGDGADVDGYLTASNLNSVATQISGLTLTEGAPNTVTGYSNGKFYATADTIDFIPANDLDAAVVEFFAVCIDLN